MVVALCTCLVESSHEISIKLNTPAGLINFRASLTTPDGPLFWSERSLSALLLQCVTSRKSQFGCCQSIAATTPGNGAFEAHQSLSTTHNP